LRLQQEAVLTTIAKLARNKLKDAKMAFPIPNKFIVPFLERASLEDEGGELVELWAELLASAAENYEPAYLRITEVLSQIGPSEVRFLKRLVTSNRNSLPITFLEDVPLYFHSPYVHHDIRQCVMEGKEAPEVVQSVIKKVEHPGGIITLALYSSEEDFVVEESHPNFERKDDVSISLLQSLGVLTTQNAITFEDGNLDITFNLVSLTSFGVMLVQACDNEVKTAFKAQEARLKQA
jgi:Abortive infection alpha